MKNRILFIGLMAFFSLISVTGSAQSCSMTVSYFSDSSPTTATDFIANSTAFGNAMANQYNTSYGLVTTGTISSLVQTTTRTLTYDITYSLPSPADTATIRLALPDIFFRLGVDGQLPASLSGYIFDVGPVSDSNTCANPPVAAVPTLSEWGLIMFGLTVLCIGAVAIRRKTMTIVAT